jgi:hypothetical protein
LHLLVAADPPLALDVDTGRAQRILGISARHQPVVSVIAVGHDAVFWVDDRRPTPVPTAELYVLRRGRWRAERLTKAWQVAPALTGRAIWTVSFQKKSACRLNEISLAGRVLFHKPVSCSAALRYAPGLGPLIVKRHSYYLLPDEGAEPVLRAPDVWEFAAHDVLRVPTEKGALRVMNLQSGSSWTVPWPSSINHIGDAEVSPKTRIIALSFSDPAYHDSGTQVTDEWLLDLRDHRLLHLPDMPASVELKFTRIAWANEDELVWLGQTQHHDFVAIWKPGDKHIHVRAIRLATRRSGSSSFVIW